MARPSIASNPAARRRAVDADRLRDLFEAMNVNMELQDIFDLANRNNVAIYAVDPRGLADHRVRHRPAVSRSRDGSHST